MLMEKQKLISYVLVRINLLKQLLLNITFYEQNLLNLQSTEVKKETLLVKAENALKPGDVELTKVDDIDGTALEGAVFKIVDAHDEKKVIRENIKNWCRW